MVQPSSFTPPKVGNGMGALPDPAAPIETTLQVIGHGVSALEMWCSLLSDPAAVEKMDDKRQEGIEVLVWYARVLMSHSGLILAEGRAGTKSLNGPQRDMLEQLRDRADEVADTLAWAGEGHEQLASNVEEECA